MSAVFHKNVVVVPKELQDVPHSVLEQYVRQRLLQFAAAFSARVCPNVSPEQVQHAVHSTIQDLPAPDMGNLPISQRELQLVFRHDCQALGCLDPQCALCQHNPHRRCSVNFDRKYLVQDVLKAKCGANIRVEVVDRATGVLFEDELPGVELDMVILDGNAYEQKCLDAGQDSDADLLTCSLEENNKRQPLLTGHQVKHSVANSHVLVPLQQGRCTLPDLFVTDSSEALLSGRKPPFRLLVRAVSADNGQAIPNIRYALSEGFVVATRRTRTAGKADIPLIDDHVGKLEHMGKETVKKLQDIRGAGASLGIDIDVPNNSIEKVGEFRMLCQLADQEGHLRQKLMQVLKLSKEKWEEARAHALKAVVPDNRMRMWFYPSQQPGVTEPMGVLFLCQQGTVQLQECVGLIANKMKTENKYYVTMTAQLNAEQRDLVTKMSPLAMSCWWQGGHPGWEVFPYDSNTYRSTGQLGPMVTLPSQPGMHPAGLPPPPSPGSTGSGLPNLLPQDPRRTLPMPTLKGLDDMNGNDMANNTQPLIPPMMMASQQQLHKSHGIPDNPTPNGVVTSPYEPYPDLTELPESLYRQQMPHTPNDLNKNDTPFFEDGKVNEHVFRSTPPTQLLDPAGAMSGGFMAQDAQLMQHMSSRGFPPLMHTLRGSSSSGGELHNGVGHGAVGSMDMDTFFSGHDNLLEPSGRGPNPFHPDMRQFSAIEFDNYGVERVNSGASGGGEMAISRGPSRGLDEYKGIEHALVADDGDFQTAITQARGLGR